MCRIPQWMWYDWHASLISNWDRLKAINFWLCHFLAKTDKWFSHRFYCYVKRIRSIRSAALLLFPAISFSHTDWGRTFCNILLGKRVQSMITYFDYLWDSPNLYVISILKAIRNDWRPFDYYSSSKFANSVLQRNSDHNFTFWNCLMLAHPIVLFVCDFRLFSWLDIINFDVNIFFTFWTTSSRSRSLVIIYKIKSQNEYHKSGWESTTSEK